MKVATLLRFIGLYRSHHGPQSSTGQVSLANNRDCFDERVRCTFKLGISKVILGENKSVAVNVMTVHPVAFETLSASQRSKR